MPHIYLLSVFVAAWTFICTRGRDGQLLATIIGFAVFAVIYWMCVFWKRPVVVGLLWHLVLFELAVVAALMIDPQLEEMGGNLNILIPSLVFAIVLMGAILRWLL